MRAAEHRVPSHSTVSIKAPNAPGLLQHSPRSRTLKSIHSTREPHPEMRFKCKQASAWSFPSSFTPCINSSADHLEFKIAVAESHTMFLTPAVNYIFCIMMRLSSSLPPFFSLCKFRITGILHFFQVTTKKHSPRVQLLHVLTLHRLASASTCLSQLPSFYYI